MVQAILRLLRATPEFQALFHTMDEFHVFGEVNVIADAASRLKLDVIQGLATQLGIAARQVQLPARALHFFEAVRAEARRIRLEMGQRASLEAAAGVGHARVLEPVGGAPGGGAGRALRLPHPHLVRPRPRLGRPRGGESPCQRDSSPRPAPHPDGPVLRKGCTNGGNTTRQGRAPKPRETPPGAGIQAPLGGQSRAAARATLGALDDTAHRRRSFSRGSSTAVAPRRAASRVVVQVSQFWARWEGHGCPHAACRHDEFAALSLAGLTAMC